MKMSDRNPSIPPSPEQVLEAVKKLSEQYEANSAANRALAREVGRRKRETRWIALGVTIVVAIAIATGLAMRHGDLQREKDRREVLATQILTQRDNLIAGCERGNDGRRTDRETIEIAIADLPIPPRATPEEVEVIEERNVRAKALRERLLARPGLQLIDCPAAYPIPAVAE